jgi:hypothetical protein
LCPARRLKKSAGMDPHRIEQTTITSTVQRQTPKAEFGDVLSQTVAQAVKVGAGIAGGVMGNPVVSAAVSAVAGITNLATGSSRSPQSLAQPISGQANVVGVGTLTSGSGVASGATGSGNSWDLLAAQQALQSDSQSFNMQYLALQDQMQKESREFTAVSNIMKVRHDTAKNAISNIH